MILDTDKQVLQAAVKFSGKPDRKKASVIIGISTHEMGEVYMSQAALDMVPPELKGMIEAGGAILCQCPSMKKAIFSCLSRQNSKLHQRSYSME